MAHEGRLLPACRRVLFVTIALLFIIFTCIPSVSPAVESQDSPETIDDAWLEEVLSRMTTADKVGQLFMVTFEGDDTDLLSDVAHLVQVLRVGSVLISPGNRNFVNEVTAPTQVLSLTTALQELAFTPSASVTITSTIPVTVTAPSAMSDSESASQPITITTVMTFTEVITLPPQGIPLLLAVSQEGDGYPYTSLRGGFTKLPSNMAVGATWSDDSARAFGQLVGQELASVGIGLLLGPSLDVLDDPRPGQSGDMGTRSFGGDPYWVGRLGKAYIGGVHEGSDGRVATVAKHLPGLGASERSLEEEISTVDKSLTDLRLIELPPFFAVTQGETITDTTDALMTAHIRYRGFQGNIRYVTPPISLHPQGLQEIMNQEELVPWRESGGVLVSDSLGVPAVRRYYSPELDSFPHRQIALDAFQAGNDLLNLSRFSLGGSWDEQMRTIEDTISFFQARYEADETFRARVDQSVRRILTLKRNVCPEFSLEECTSDLGALDELSDSSGTVAQTAQEAITLLYPSVDELAARMPRPPRAEENILIFTDAREARDCSLCSPFYLLEPGILEDTILQLYGPDATGQVDPARVTSYTLAELSSFLQYGSPDLDAVVRDADWIVFAMLDYAPAEYPSSAALKQFLREWTVGLETQNVIVMAYEAPYYLDATEVSKLAAYYGVYSKVAPFIDTSVRTLFLELAPVGRSPVSVAGVGYDLAEQLSPDPAQVISVLRADQPAPVEGTPPPLELEVGDSFDVRTSVIVDQNGNPVPNGTPVTFASYYVEEELERRVEAETQDGVAKATITLELEGNIEIRATSEPATDSLPLVVRLTGGTTEILTPTPTATPTFTPTPTPTFTPTPTSTPTPTPTWTPTPTPTSTPTPKVVPPPPPEPRVEWLDLAGALAGIALAAALVVLAARGSGLQDHVTHPYSRLILWAVVCGLAGYIYFGRGLPGSSFLENVAPGLRGLLVGFGCGLLPLLAVFLLALRRRRTSR